MNRIYFGRISSVTLCPEPEIPLEDWQDRVWEHHVLYHDAINYYTLCLAILARGAGAALVDQPDSARLKAVSEWRKQVHENWNTFSPRRATRPVAGPHASLVRRLGSRAEGADTFEDLERAIVRFDSADNVRLAALLRILDILGNTGTQEGNQADADLTPKARSIMPPLFQSVLKGGDAVEASEQLRKSQNATRRVREALPAQLESVAAALDLNCFLKTAPDATLAYTGECAFVRLRACFDQAAEASPDLKALEETFVAKLKQQLQEAPQSLVMPKGNKPPAVFHAMAVFKFLPGPITHAVAIRASESLLKRKPESIDRDPLSDTRSDGPLFDYFTTLTLKSAGKAKAQGVWFDFDLAAFVEALKAPHRYFQDTQKREQAADKLRIELALMDPEFAAAHPHVKLPKGLTAGRGKAPGDTEDAIYGFCGDKRIQRIRELVVSDALVEEAEAEGDTEEVGKRQEFGIRERTLRGYEEVRRKWRQLADKGDPSQNQLEQVVREIQAEHPLDFGSSKLYYELAKPHYHTIWRDDPLEDWHAPNPLAAWMQFQDAHSELRAKERPIKFTPADPKFSPRYFAFPKASETQQTEVSRKPKPGLASRHLPGELAFYCGLVLDGTPKPVKITYSAPRLLRDHLRSPESRSGEPLHQAPWLQPLVEPLEFSKELDRQNFANCRVSLQPEFDRDGKLNGQLTFPVPIDASKLRERIGRVAKWRSQFFVSGSGDFEPMALLWPGEPQSKKRKPTWLGLDEFRVVAVDLGQSVAGAIAVVHTTKGSHGGPHSRRIGSVNGVSWYARAERRKLLRLPGEDAKEWRDGRWQEELFGSKGRRSSHEELQQARDILRELDTDEREVFPDLWADHLSFPEINDGLLRATRRALARLGRMHRWSWFLSRDDKKDAAFQEIKGELTQAHEASVKFSGHAAPETVRGEVADLVRAHLKTEADEKLPEELREPLIALLRRRINQEKLRLPVQIAALANRILPWRRRRWQWRQEKEHFQLEAVDDPQTARVLLRGQRGLSFARIEQIDNFRKRVQTLNHLVRREAGTEPPNRRQESIPDPCPEITEKLNRMKEQRVDQTAHLILAEALGMELQPPPPDKRTQKRRRDLHGVYQKSRPTVDFIVIENLSRYRTSQGRAPRENNRLMKWCHRAARDKLVEMCEPFGIPILETPAAYSSRFCSRTGYAGFRARQVDQTLFNDRYWSAREKELMSKNEKELSAEEKELARVFRQLRDQRMAVSPTTKLLMPHAGGTHFVPLRDHGQKEFDQADINAAVNLALRAVAQPTCWDIHSRLRTNQRKIADGKTFFAVNEKRAFGEAEVLVEPQGAQNEADDERLPNFFFEVSGAVDSWGQASLVGSAVANGVHLVSAKALWRTVKDAQWKRCAEINARRLAAISGNAPASVPPAGDVLNDDTPF